MNLYDFIYGYIKDHIEDDEIAKGLSNHIHYQARKLIKRYSVLSFIAGIVFVTIVLLYFN
jgi:hypothetical protein